jgi:hypothetical protein
MVPVFIWMAILGGTLQHAALVAVMAVMAMWADEAWDPRVARNDGWHTRARGQVFLLGRYAACGLLGLCLAAIMLLPCTAAFVASNRLGQHTGMHGNAENGIYPDGW